LFGGLQRRAVAVVRAEAEIIGVAEPSFCTSAFVLIHEVWIIGESAGIHKEELPIRGFSG
jgi:hypothetical protein